jgi:hypothetical protein
MPAHNDIGGMTRTSVAMEQLNKHVSAEANTRNNRGAEFSVWSLPRGYKRDKEDRLSQGTRTRERLRWQGPVAHTKGRPVLSSERALHGIKNVTVRRIPFSVRK